VQPSQDNISVERPSKKNPNNLRDYKYHMEHTKINYTFKTEELEHLTKSKDKINVDISVY
jgi:hypothetical protein